MSNPHVIVIGAGLGGLCLAQGLRRAGIGVAVYERDSAANSRRQGHRLHIDEQGRAALAATLPAPLYTLLATIAGRPAPNVQGFDHRLRPTGAFPLDDSDPAADTGMPAHTVLDRQVLRRILLTGLGDIVHFGHRCIGYDSDTATVTAHFADGSAARGAVLIAADGIGSAIRPQLLPHARIMDSRIRLIYGRVPLTSDLRRALPPAMISIFTTFLGPGHRFVGIAPVEYREPPARAASRLAPEVVFEPIENTLAVMFGRRADQLPMTDADLRAASGHRLRELALTQLRDWHPLLTRIVGDWTPHSIYPITVRTSIPVPPWPTTNVTLLGDAIHAMSPAAGAGANCALRDAAALTTALTQVSAGRPLLAALGDYERTMIEHGFWMVRRSAANAVRLLRAEPLPESVEETL